MPSQVATPAEAVCPAGVTLRTRSSSSVAFSSEQLGRTIANSSPPQRAKLSVARTSARRRVAPRAADDRRRAGERGGRGAGPGRSGPPRDRGGPRGGGGRVGRGAPRGRGRGG